MAIQKTEKLHSVEFVNLGEELPAINLCWKTIITEDGNVLSETNFRRAVSGDDIAEVLPEIHGVLSEAGLSAIARVNTLETQVLEQQQTIAALLAQLQ